MKVLTVFGARPQFIKAAMLSKEIRKAHEEIMVHTGQHFDNNMSRVFFDELKMPQPLYNLGISGGTHSEMTGRMMIELEKVFLVEKPDLIIVYGDTNSTLAAALAAVKIHIPVAHVESGNRFGTLDNPEEVNRICTDHVSSILFACTKSAYDSLLKENLGNKSHLVGDLMFDAFCYIKDYVVSNDVSSIEASDLFDHNITINLKQPFYFLTCHRQENSTENTLKIILDSMQNLDLKVIYPVHPRNKEIVKKLISLYDYSNIIFTQPIGYIESIACVLNATKIITDSGGVQREAFFAKKQCLTLLDFVCWPETMVNNCNQLCKPDEILTKISTSCLFDNDNLPFGDGNSAKKILDCLEDFFND